MLCHIARRTISRAEDGGKTPPRWVERHAARCGSCREFARFTSSLKARLAAEVPGVLGRAPDVRLDPVFSPAPAGSDHGAAGGTARGLRRPWPVLRALPAAAAALAVAAGGLFLFQVVLRQPAQSPNNRAAALAALRSVAAAPDGFQGAVTEAESSLEGERLILERSFASAVEYLQARLNIRIERR